MKNSVQLSRRYTPHFWRYSTTSWIHICGIGGKTLVKETPKSKQREDGERINGKRIAYLHLPHFLPLLPCLLPYTLHCHLPIVPIPHRDQISFVPYFEFEPRPNSKLLSHSVHKVFKCRLWRHHDVSRVVARMNFDTDVLQLQLHRAPRSRCATAAASVAARWRSRGGAGKTATGIIQDFKIGKRGSVGGCISVFAVLGNILGNIVRSLTTSGAVTDFRWTAHMR